MNKKMFDEFESGDGKYLRCNACGKWFENKGDRKKIHLKTCYRTLENKYVSDEKKT